MANLSRIPVRHDEIFPDGVLFLGVEPAIDFDRRNDADNQQRDKDSNQRVWTCSVFDPKGEKNKREIQVKMLADVQPVPEGGVMHPVVFDGLTITPYVNDKGRVQLSMRATGFRASRQLASAKS